VNRIDRLLGVILLLQSRRVVTAEQIAARFEISVRTVYRDLSALSEIGVPIAAEAGVGYSLLRGYHLPPLMFSEAEASALFIGSEMVKEFADRSLAGPTDSALLKIRAVLPREQREQAERILQRTAVIGSPRQTGHLDRGILLPIQRAVALQRVLFLEYQAKGREQTTPREVEPLGVVYYGGAWYLIAWCRLRADFRHFRLDRIRYLAVREATFESRPGFSLRAHLAESVRKEDTIPARVRFSPEAAERARHECFAGLVEERQVDGRVEMDFLTFSLEWLARWVLSFGREAEAVSPERLRALVRTEAEQVERLYGEAQHDDAAGVFRAKAHNQGRKAS
jgi:predicted DNA-binding transcriptional regulator YafY